MPDEQSFTINALTNYDDQFWRIDWFGYLTYYDKHGQRTSEPLVEVILSPMKEMGSKAYRQSYRKIQVPVSYLRVLRLGDIWRAGKKVNPSRHKLPLTKKSRRTFEGVTITPSTTQTLPSGATLLNHFILPFAQHPHHQSATKTYCEVVNLGADGYLVVPHYVLLQSYFGASQYVFQQVFKFGLQLNTLYNPNETGLIRNGSCHFIMLKTKVEDVAAAEVARIAFDETAYLAIKKISEAFSMQETKGEPIRPKSHFPFTGNTDLIVEGINWNADHRSHSVFLVQNIMNCSAKYPFEDLEYFRENPGDEDSAGDKKAPRKPSNKKNKAAPSRKNEPDIGPDNNTTNETDPMDLLGRPKTKFKDLDNKPIKKVRQKPHQGEHSRRGRQESEEKEHGNTTDGSPKGDAAQVNWKAQEEEKKKRYVFNYRVSRLKLFQQLLKNIRKQPRVKNIEYVQVYESLGDHQSVYSFFPNEYTSTSRKTKWQLINYIKGVKPSGPDHDAHRKALIAKIDVGNNCTIYLIETERRVRAIYGGYEELDSTPLFAAIARNNNSISKEQFSTLLRKYVNNRTWDHHWHTHSIKSYSIKHVSNDQLKTDTFIERQLSAIEKRLGFGFSVRP